MVSVVKTIVLGSILFLSYGCTIASHIDKNKYWVMNDSVQKLPKISVRSDYDYVNYPEILQKKGVFEDVVTSGNSDVYVDIKHTFGGPERPLLALPWMLVSALTAFTIPYRSDQLRTVEFSVEMGGGVNRKFRYTDVKQTWIAFFALPFIRKENEEYFVEEKMSDQFVNSFIIDLLKDPEILPRNKSI